MYTGSCLCGGIQFRITSELQSIQICHCSQCRKAQGGAFAANTPVDGAAFELCRGAELLASFEATPGKQRVFCRQCGSPIYSQRQTVPGILRVRVGLLNEALPLPPTAHFCTASKANWWPINDDLPQFEGAYVPAQHG